MYQYQDSSPLNYLQDGDSKILRYLYAHRYGVISQRNEALEQQTFVSRSTVGRSGATKQKPSTFSVQYKQPNCTKFRPIISWTKSMPLVSKTHRGKNAFPVHVIQAYRWNRGVASLILSLGARTCVVTFTRRPLYSRERKPALTEYLPRLPLIEVPAVSFTFLFPSAHAH